MVWCPCFGSFRGSGEGRAKDGLLVFGTHPASLEVACSSSFYSDSEGVTDLQFVCACQGYKVASMLATHLC